MSAVSELFPTPPTGQAGPPTSPAVFVRTLSAPPGAPWDQARVADLDAQVGAPLPLEEVIYQLHRLEPWRPGRPGRYAACYVRIEEAGQAFQSKVDVAGRTIIVRFLSTEERNRRALRLGGAALVVGIMAFLVGGALTSAISMRSEISDRLSVVEQTAQVRSQAAKVQERQRRQAQMLDAAGVRHLGVKDVLADLAWASSAKAPDAHIDTFHWDHGRMAVEVRGDAAPFAQTTRTVVKDSKPLRPNVWLWGVEPANAKSADGAP